MKKSFLFAALIALASTLSAQTEAEMNRAQFRVFPVLSFDTKGIYYRPAPEEEMVELEFRARARSMETYEYIGPPVIDFYRQAGLNEEGEMQYRTVGKTKAVAPEILIFFTAKPGGNGGSDALALLAVDDSPSAMPADHVTFLNFTSIPFHCRFMDKDMEILPGENEPISVRSRLKEDIFIGLAVTNEKTHRVVLESRWQFNPGNRHHILLLPPKREGSFRIRALRVTEFVGENDRFGQLTYPPFLTSQR